jgi:hypothetical protein
LAPTVGIAATRFCHPGGILQIFSSTRSTNFTAADNRSSQIDSTEFIINISYHLHRQDHQHPLSSTEAVIVIVCKIFIDQLDRRRNRYVSSP